MMKFHSIYIPRNRLLPNAPPSMYEHDCAWVGRPDPIPEKPLNVRKFIAKRSK